MGLRAAGCSAPHEGYIRYYGTTTSHHRFSGARSKGRGSWRLCRYRTVPVRLRRREEARKNERKGIITVPRGTSLLGAPATGYASGGWHQGTTTNISGWIRPSAAKRPSSPTSSNPSTSSVVRCVVGHTGTFWYLQPPYQYTKRDMRRVLPAMYLMLSPKPPRTWYIPPTTPSPSSFPAFVPQDRAMLRDYAKPAPNHDQISLFLAPPPSDPPAFCCCCVT